MRTESFHPVAGLVDGRGRRRRLYCRGKYEVSGCESRLTVFTFAGWGVLENYEVVRKIGMSAHLLHGA